MMPMDAVCSCLRNMLPPFRRLFLAALLLFVTSCLRQALPESETGERVCLTVCPRGAVEMGKSGCAGSPDRVYSYVLMAYRLGHLDASVRSTEGTPQPLRLLKGCSYHLYALAHAGTFEVPVLEEDLLSCSLPGGAFPVEDGQACALPMAWSRMDYIPQSEAPLTLDFERLFAKLVVGLDKSSLTALSVTSLRLRQAASRVYPFRPGVKATQVCDGDAATTADLSRLNGGGNLELYIPENCQGTLLKGNEQAQNRLPENLGDAAGLCTYLEMSVQSENANLMAGEATARIYLGENAADNFDVRRGAVLDLSLCWTDRLLGGLDWRIESRWQFQRGSVEGWIAEGMHGVGDLYRGERFRYAVRPSDELLSLLGGNLDNCGLCCRVGETLSSALSFSEWDVAGGVWLSDALCEAPAADASIWLTISGKPIVPLSEGVRVRWPYMSLEGSPTAVLNGEEQSYALTFADRDGRLLSDCYGFDYSLYEMDYDWYVSNTGLSDTDQLVQVRTEPPTAAYPLGRMTLRLVNQSKDYIRQRELTRTLGQPLVTFYVEEMSKDTLLTCSVAADIAPIDIRIKDAQDGNGEWEVQIRNPSRLPVDLGWVMAGKLDQSCSATALPEEYVSREITSLNRFTDDALAVDAVVRDLIPDTSVADTLRTVRLRGLSFCTASLGRLPYKLSQGLEPSWHYPGTQALLDEKIRVFPQGEAAQMPLLQMKTSGFERSGDGPCPDPVWLRYSAYDDLRTLQVWMRYSEADAAPLVSLTPQGDTATFKVLLTGSVFGGMHVTPNGTLWGGDYDYQTSVGFTNQSTDFPADGQGHPLPGTLRVQLDALYFITVQDDYTWLGTSHYDHHVRPQYTQSTFYLMEKYPSRHIWVPSFDVSLDLNYYHAQDNVTLSVYTAALNRDINKVNLWLFERKR